MALLELVRPFSCTFNFMSPGACCMCGLPVRDHAKHLCVPSEPSKQPTKPCPKVEPKLCPPSLPDVKPVLKPTPPPVQVPPNGVTKVSPRLSEEELSSADLQLWLNTLSRNPAPQSPTVPVPQSLPLVPAVKTIAQQTQVQDTVSSVVQREHKQAIEECDNEAVFTHLSQRQTLLKKRLSAAAKRLFRFKTHELTKHIVLQLDKFDEHAIQTQVEPSEQHPCRHTADDRPHGMQSNEPPIDGHAFSTVEKLRVGVAENDLRETSSLLACYDDDNTESSSGEEDEDHISSDHQVERSRLSVIEQNWEQQRAHIAAQWTWIRGQYEDLQHRMRRETDLLQGLRDKKEKIVFHPSDHFMPDLLSDKTYHGMQGLNGFPSNLMKNNFKFDGLNRANKDEMFMKNSQSKMCESICKPKRVTKISKADGNSCARTRPLAFLVRRQTVQGKSNQSSIVPRNVVLKSSILGKQCCRRQRVASSRGSKTESYHPVLSAKNECHLATQLTPLLSGVDYFPGPERKPINHCITPVSLHEPPEPKLVLPEKRKSPPLCLPVDLLQHHTDVQIETMMDTPTLVKKRGSPAATVEHMPKKYRASASLPGSRATSPIHGDKRKRNDQFDINNIEVDFSVVAPARIERPRYKEIEIPKFRLIDDSLLAKIASIHPDLEDDSDAAYEALHSHCEGLEKQRFINMTINATGGMRGSIPTPESLPASDHLPLNTSQDMLMSLNTMSPTLNNHTNYPPPSPASSSSGDEGPSETWSKRSFPLLECQANKLNDSDHILNNKSDIQKTDIDKKAHRKNDNKHVSYLDEEVRRTRSKHTSEYPTAVS